MAEPTTQPMEAPPQDLSLWHNLRYDLPAGLVVFLVALPLCLGIALASGAPLFAGVLAGAVGGLVVPLISRSELSVSGPAAGLAAVVVAGISRVGGFEALLAAVVIGGALQVVLGLVRGGAVTYFVPSSVIKGMLGGIGVLLVLKQLPHAVGYDVEQMGADEFVVSAGENTLTLLGHSLMQLSGGAVLISVVCIPVLVAFDRIGALKRLTLVPGPLVAVLLGTGINEALRMWAPAWALWERHTVALPQGGWRGAMAEMRTPALDAFLQADVWVLGLTLGLVASLETLLSVEAVDRMDPFQRRSPPNRELLAQGVANAISGMVGGLPITAVIIRSSVNVNAGGRTRMSALVHGVLLLVAVLLMAPMLSHVPLAALAAILLVTGYKLARPALWKSMWHLGLQQFVPFAVTIAAVVLADLLKGIVVGIVVGLGFVIRQNMQRSLTVRKRGSKFLVLFSKDMYFFSRAALMNLFERIPDGARVVVDVQASRFTDLDVADTIHTFQASALRRGIAVEVHGSLRDPSPQAH